MTDKELGEWSLYIRSLATEMLLFSKITRYIDGKMICEAEPEQLEQAGLKLQEFTDLLVEHAIESANKQGTIVVELE